MQTCWLNKDFEDTNPSEVSWY